MLDVKATLTDAVATHFSQMPRSFPMGNYNVQSFQKRFSKKETLPRATEPASFLLSSSICLTT